MINCLNRRIIAAVAAAATSIIIPVTASYAQLETPTDVVAAQLRRQGLPCTAPQPAVRDQKRSTPNMAVWTVRCDEASYRVTLVPNLAAKVERADDKEE